MNKKKTVFFVSILFVSAVFALEWPSDSTNFMRLFGETSTFDESKHFEYGFSFANTENIRAADYGKKLIVIENKHSMNNFPSALGNAVILIHQDNIQTVYGNLKNTDIIQSRTKTDTGSIIGYTGNSGCTKNKSLIFQVLDVKNNVYINPGLLLPPIKDSFSPRIHKAFVVNSKNQLLPLSSSSNLVQGWYKLYIQTSDFILNTSKEFNPAHISVILNGTGKEGLSFQTISIKNGQAFIKGNFTANDLYSRKDSIFLGEINLTAGNAILQITAKDLKGNKTTKIFNFQVR